MSEQNAPIEDHPHGAAAETTAEATVSKPVMPPAVALAFVIIALLGVLIVIGVRGNMGGSGAGSAELTELQAEANALRNQLNRERVSMGLRPLEGNTESMEEIAARLKKNADSMVALAGSFQSMLADKDTELSAKGAELIRSEQLRQSLAAESSRLQGELQRALVSGSDADLLRRDLAAMKSQRDALAAELASVRGELAAKGQGASADEFADLQRRLEETQRAKEFFEARVTELESELSKAKLFASSENELLPAAIELFRSLRKLEGQTDAEISTAYSSLGASLGANVLHTLNFATGSSQLAPADQEMIRNLVADIPDGDLVLAIGYASETGNVDSNRALSSDRATAAAALFSSVKRPAQQVQAVYLGQTDRFSSRIPERNQLVEIWRIRKK
jgi:outer membrane protein OmpA-like peptidoglycan-associated protein